jgi:hypothetical protein
MKGPQPDRPRGSDPQREAHTGLVIPFEGLALAA